MAGVVDRLVVESQREASLGPMIHRFDRYELDEDRYELRRIGDAGTDPEPIELQPKVMDVLLHLVRNAERTLTKDELLDAVWGDVSITEASLTRCISLVRRALGEHEGEARIIKTVRGRGYAIGVEVEASAPAPAATPIPAPEPDAPADEALPPPLPVERTPDVRRGRSRRVAVLAASAFLVAALGGLMRPFEPGLVAPDAPPPLEGPSSSTVAVLPFVDLRSETSRSRAADGLVMQVIERLSEWPELMVTSPRSSFRFDPASAIEPAEVGAQLGVGTLVLGTLRADGEGGTRVHIEAVDAATGFQRWSESFRLSSPGSGDAEIAGRVAESLGLGVALNPLRPDVVSVEAQELLLRGREAVLEADRGRLIEAVETYERALELDPELLRAYVALAEVYLSLWERAGELSTNAVELLAAGEGAVLEALERAPEDPQALATYGQVKIAQRDWVGAEAALALSLENHGGARSSMRMAAVLMMTGRVEAARPHVERAVRLDPLADQTLRMAGRFHLYAEEPERAVWYLRRALELEPRALYAPRLLANAYFVMGELDSARESYYRILPGWARPLARAQDRLFGSARNLRWMLEIDILRSGRPCRGDPHGTALLLAQLGERESMLECLAEAAQHHLWYARVEPALSRYAGDPEFEQLMADAGFGG